MKLTYLGTLIVARIKAFYLIRWISEIAQAQWQYNAQQFGFRCFPLLRILQQTPTLCSSLKVLETTLTVQIFQNFSLRHTLYNYGKKGGLLFCKSDVYFLISLIFLNLNFCIWNWVTEESLMCHSLNTRYFTFMTKFLSVKFCFTAWDMNFLFCQEIIWSSNLTFISPLI